MLSTGMSSILVSIFVFDPSASCDCVRAWCVDDVLDLHMLQGFVITIFYSQSWLEKIIAGLHPVEYVYPNFWVLLFQTLHSTIYFSTRFSLMLSFLVPSREIGTHLHRTDLWSLPFARSSVEIFLYFSMSPFKKDISELFLWTIFE